MPVCLSVYHYVSHFYYFRVVTLLFWTSFFFLESTSKISSTSKNAPHSFISAYLTYPNKNNLSQSPTWRTSPKAPCEHARNHRKRGKAKPGHQASYLFIGLPFSLPTPALALLAVELTQINERSVCHSCLRLAQGSMFSSQMLLFLSVNLFKMLQLQKDKKAVKPF